MKTYNPPEPSAVSLCTADIQRFIARDDRIEILIKAALLHYQMEDVHPFDSGSGKIGCILVSLYLLKTNTLSNMLLPISEFFKGSKVEYFDRIKAVYNFGEYEQFVKFF